MDPGDAAEVPMAVLTTRRAQEDTANIIAVPSVIAQKGCR
jgi:hypothetical protein